MLAFGSRWTRRCAILGVATMALLIVSVPLGPWLIREQPLDRPDAILVLGSHEHERLPHAARLARQWPEADVLLTQPVFPTPLNCQDCEQRGSTLERAGVARGRVRILRPRVRTSFDEMRAAAGWVEASGKRRLLVVTSPYHTRRVRALARALLPRHWVGIAACPVADGLARPWWSRRYDRRYVIYEAAAIVSNAWRHGIPPRLWLGS
jgi:uncharacterized SAM-binding protein YcdF (DUF218 family)